MALHRPDESPFDTFGELKNSRSHGHDGHHGHRHASACRSCSRGNAFETLGKRFRTFSRSSAEHLNVVRRLFQAFIWGGLSENGRRGLQNFLGDSHDSHIVTDSGRALFECYSFGWNDELHWPPSTSQRARGRRRLTLGSAAKAPLVAGGATKTPLDPGGIGAMLWASVFVGGALVSTVWFCQRRHAEDGTLAS